MPRQKSGTYNHKEYQAEYQRSMKRIFLTFNPTNENDMILFEYVKAQDNTTGYIKELIRADMVKNLNPV